MATPSETLHESPGTGRQRRLRTLAIVPAYNEQDCIATVLEEIHTAEPDLHVVVTGRNARPELIELADLVTEMKLVKHPYREQHVKPQKGIEF